MANTEGSITIKISTQSKKVLDEHLKRHPAYTLIGFASQAIVDAVASDERRLTRKTIKK